ncbi:MAG: hypothetical protein O9295_12730 [Microcystis sp. LE18-22.4A]|nr:hypothetical protein [Microcystis sp. LE18-22.4A]
MKFSYLPTPPLPHSPIPPFPHFPITLHPTPHTPHPTPSFKSGVRNRAILSVFAILDRFYPSARSLVRDSLDP